MAWASGAVSQAVLEEITKGLVNENNHYYWVPGLAMSRVGPELPALSCH